MTNKELLEVQNSVLSLTVGIVFVADFVFAGNLYDRFPDTYQYMRFMPSLIWGAIYGGAGIIHLVTIFYPSLAKLRKQILLTKSALWMFLGFCVVSSDVYAAVGYFYFIFAIVAVISFIRFHRPKEDSHAYVSHSPTFENNYT